MLRRIACLLLVPALLANQAAIGCAHHHHGLEADDHAARTHVHLFGHCHNGDDDDHHHGDTGAHRHTNERGTNDHESHSDFDSICPVDHDKDAIFLGEQDIIQIQPNRLTVEVSTCFVICYAGEMTRALVSDDWNRVARAGPFLPYHCAVYLQTRCLLI